MHENSPHRRGLEKGLGQVHARAKVRGTGQAEVRAVGPRAIRPELGMV